MKANLTIGQRLRTTTNEYVTIVRMEGQDIYVRYRNKIYRRDRSIVGHKLFVVPEELPSTATASLEKQSPKKTCANCMVMRKGDCFGGPGICSFFRHAPTIAQEKMDNWPKYGDATNFRLKRRKR